MKILILARFHLGCVCDVADEGSEVASLNHQQIDVDPFLSSSLLQTGLITVAQFGAILYHRAEISGINRIWGGLSC